MLTDLSQMQVAVAAAVGLILPLVLALPIQEHWSPPAKTLFSLAAYGAAAVVTALAAGKLTGATWWQSALIIFLTGATSHEKVWKPSGISDAVEAATTGALRPQATTVVPTPATSPATVGMSAAANSDLASAVLNGVGTPVPALPSGADPALQEPADVPGVDDLDEPIPSAEPDGDAELSGA